MIKSMTGYGRHQANLDGYDITVEVKSVNHRYFEFSARVPRAYGYLDEKLKSFCNQKIARGKVDLYVSIIPVEAVDTQVQINKHLAQSYLQELRELSDFLDIKDDMTLSSIARFNDIYNIRREPDDEDLIWNLVQQVADVALDQFLEMRVREGDKMKADISSRLDLLEGYIDNIEAKSPETVSQWRNRLEERVRQVLEDRQLDEARIITEVAIFAERVAVDEETVRLKSHISQFRAVLNEDDSVGRKLDFLVQEINRETNTIGSKCQDADVAKIVVEMKSETEKIREQIQNIE